MQAEQLTVLCTRLYVTLDKCTSCIGHGPMKNIKIAIEGIHFKRGHKRVQYFILWVKKKEKFGIDSGSSHYIVN